MNETKNRWSVPSRDPRPAVDDDTPTVVVHMDESYRALVRQSSRPPDKPSRPPDDTDPPEAA